MGYKEQQVVGDPSLLARGPNTAGHQQGDAAASHITA